VAQTYKLAEQADPRLDTDKRIVFILQQQLRGYHVTDKPAQPQAAVTGSILREFYKILISQMDKTICELFIGAFFFAMRSCEYLKVSGKCKTKLICIRNIRFFLGKHQLLHSDRLLHLADSVSITFEQQKHDSKNDTITQPRSGDKLLCPVKIWCKIIQRLLSYTSSNQDTPVNTFILPNGKLHYFTGSKVLKRLRITAKAIGPDTLRFTADQIGLHSKKRSSNGNVPSRYSCV
jgi:hypothetical protein